jgi:hypothetical protein
MNYIYGILIIVVILGLGYVLISKKSIDNFTLDKFNYISEQQSIELDDDFGSIIKSDPVNYKIQEYIEGFESTPNPVIGLENFAQETKPLEKIHTPRYVWTYWENKSGRTEPFAHIKLCFRTMSKHYSQYKFIILNDQTIKQYLPNVRTDLSQLLIAQKVDYYRIALLYWFGGIWVDADTIAMKNLDQVFEKLDNGYDFVGFGCTGKICFSGYPNPSNGVMGSRPKGKLMGCCLQKLNDILDTNNKSHKYFALGKEIIWSCLEISQPYDYYHFPSEYDGSRDNLGNWIHSPNHLAKNKTKLLDESKVLFIFLANYELMNEPENAWFLELDENQILNGDFWISDLFRRALKN